MTGSGTVLSCMARTVVSAYEDFTSSPERVARDVLGSAELLHDTDARLPFGAYAQLWDVCGQASGDPQFGLHAATGRMQAGTFGVVGFMARSAPTLRDGLIAVVRHGAVLNETSKTQLFVDGDVAVIRDGPAASGARWPRHKAEFVMAAYVLLTFEWAGVARQPVAVSFQHEAPLQLESHHAVFGTDLTFEAPYNQLRFPAEWLTRPMQGAEPELFRFLERRAGELGAALDVERDLLGELRRVVAASLPSGVPSIEEVARSMGTGHRTLQRRLQDEGTGFRELVDQVRFQHCRTLLVDHSLTIDVVSSKLGFSDARAFRRAVRRWTGLTPGNLRRRLA